MMGIEAGMDDLQERHAAQIAKRASQYFADCCYGIALGLYAEAAAITSDASLKRIWNEQASICQARLNRHYDSLLVEARATCT